MKATHEKLIGPGGIKCPCCTKDPSVKWTRTKVNRVTRHQAKQNLQKEIDAELLETRFIPVGGNQVLDSAEEQEKEDAKDAEFLALWFAYESTDEEISARYRETEEKLHAQYMEDFRRDIEEDFARDWY